VSSTNSKISWSIQAYSLVDCTQIFHLKAAMLATTHEPSFSEESFSVRVVICRQNQAYLKADYILVYFDQVISLVPLNLRSTKSKFAPTLHFISNKTISTKSHC